MEAVLKTPLNCEAPLITLDQSHTISGKNQPHKVAAKYKGAGGRESLLYHSELLEV